ncbi:MAG: xanthine dehydrogenase family protein subunit M [Desulfobacterales bacterium]|nr:xanthine dehydrogenase family protein subunit M [Desulfobacterales bacterium]
MNDGIFFKASTSDEICNLLFRFGKKAQLLAGGTDLMVSINRQHSAPEVLIYIGESELDYIKEDKEHLIMGAATPFTKIIDSDLVQKNAPLLCETVSTIGSPAIQNVGTVGGNLATASPAADSAIALLALGATIKIVAKNNERYIPIESFFKGPRKTVLNTGEFIQNIIIPKQSIGSRWVFRKLGKRKAQTLSIVSVGILASMGEGKCSDIKIALGAVAPTPVLAVESMNIIKGKTFDSNLVSQAAQAATDATNPIDDARSSAWYRRKVTSGLVRQLLTGIMK